MVILSTRPSPPEGQTPPQRFARRLWALRCALFSGILGLGLATNTPLALAQTSSAPDASSAPGAAPETPGAQTGSSASTTSTPSSSGSSASTSASTTSAATQARLALRSPRAGDYLAALGALALVLSAKRHPSPSAVKAFEGDQQFSAISPFPGGGYSVLPDGQFRPGGAMGVNIPLAYVPNQFEAGLSVDVAQNRGNQSLSTENGRNGTATIGVGFPVFKRGVWLSTMLLSQYSLSHPGNDDAYCAEVQLAPETSRLPAIAVGVQDATNARIRSPFLVATKQLGTAPLFATFGLGRGRFSGSGVFGGLSYSPIRRLSLDGEYDGLQFNVGAGFAVSKHLSLLASYNDLANAANRPAGRLGRRYQFGANLAF